MHVEVLLKLIKRRLDVQVLTLKIVLLFCIKIIFCVHIEANESKQKETKRNETESTKTTP